jgi:hypothetical protein
VRSTCRHPIPVQPARADALGYRSAMTEPMCHPTTPRTAARRKQLPPAHPRRVRGNSRAVFAESKAALALLTARGAPARRPWRPGRPPRCLRAATRAPAYRPSGIVTALTVVPPIRMPCLLVDLGDGQRHGGVFGRLEAVRTGWYHDEVSPLPLRGPRPRRAGPDRAAGARWPRRGSCSASARPPSRAITVWRITFSWPPTTVRAARPAGARRAASSCSSTSAPQRPAHALGLSPARDHRARQFSRVSRGKIAACRHPGKTAAAARGKAGPVNKVVIAPTVTEAAAVEQHHAWLVWRER